MLFDADDILGDLAQRATERSLPTAFDRAAIISALAEANRLAGGDLKAEPAALFFAFARCSRTFGKLAMDFVPDIARACAFGYGFELNAGIELDIFRARILRTEMTFEELRADFAKRLRPLG